MKKMTNMLWRCMRETILLCLLLLFCTLVILYGYGLLGRFGDWENALHAGGILLLCAVMGGSIFGFWTSNRTRQQLERLSESMLLLEKGNFSRAVPDLGEDEIGTLSQQLGRISKKWEEQVTTLQRLSNNNAQLAEKARVSAMMEERQRLARELHDAVSQQLFAISMTTTAVKRTLETDYEKAKKQIALVEEMASVAQSEMRALLLHLRPVHLQGKSLSHALQELIVEIKNKVPIEIQQEIEPGISLPKGIEDHLFRILQEALSNVLRHSRANHLEIKLMKRPDSVRLIIADDGVGFELNSDKQASYGIVSMQERVNELGGSFHVVTAPGKGARIEIRIPIVLEEGENHVGQTD